MESTALKPIPGPSPLAAVRALRQSGFLAYIGELWQACGDIFQLRLGPRTLILAIHPETVRHVNITKASNPAVAAKLHEELDTVLGDRYPAMEDLHRLPYTLQVIKEVLRLYPPAPFYARDAVGADTLDGYVIPAGSVVMMSPYYTHRHPDFWENPQQSDPDRWVPDREAERHPYAYHPFAAGQRICIGNNFSLLVSHILLALLAKRFVPRLAAGYTPQWVMQGVLSTANGLPMLIETR